MQTTNKDIKGKTEVIRDIKKEAVKEVIKEQFKEKVKDQNYLQGEIEKSEKIKATFDKIEFLSLSDEQKWEVSVQIKEDAKMDKLYIMELILSILIATLGLLQNSVAVVVGAMLIAPIMRPITGLSYALARGDGKVLKTSISMLGISVLASIFFAFLSTKIIGLHVETPEILGRINPNLIDFFIAIFSGMVGVMSFKYDKLSTSIWGVAMAVALVPPLAVVGIEAAFGNYFSALGAFLLFLTNILAIGLISTIFFWLYGFTPHNKNLQSKVLLRLLVFVFSLILILIPLSFSYLNLINSAKTSFQIEKSLEQVVDENTLWEVMILEETEEKTQVKITINIPENVSESEILEQIKEKLKKDFQKKMKVEFDIKRIFEI